MKASIPILKDSKLLLTTHFYQRVFSINSEMKHTFNKDNQQNGRQLTALAMALLAYAEYSDEPSVLLPTIMVGIEANLYAAQVTDTGDWTGWRPFEIKTKIEESNGITSFHLYPTDGGPIADYRPGQHLNVRVFMAHLNQLQSSQYTITNAPNGLYYCISYKRTAAKGHSSNRTINSRLCDVVQVGDRLDVMAPAGICAKTSQVEMAVFSASRRAYPMHLMA